MRKKLMWFVALTAVVSLTAMTGVASAAGLPAVDAAVTVVSAAM